MSHALIDYLYPRPCLLCGMEQETNSLCYNCLDTLKNVAPFTTIDYDRVFSERYALLPFDMVQSVVHRLKYQGVKYEVSALISRLNEERWLPDFVARHDMLVPVPLHWWRLLRRGYNQSMVIAQAMDSQKATAALRRLRHTITQTKLSRSKRMENVQGSFGLRKGREVEGMRILLVDDVATTGATARECAQVLLKEGACAVSLLTLAQA